MEPGNVVAEGMLTDRPFMRPFWGLVGDFDTGTIGDYYTCPCYKAPRRTGLNFVTSVDLRVEENPSKWVLRGVALLTSTE